MSWLDYLRGPAVAGGLNLGPLTIGGSQPAPALPDLRQPGVGMPMASVLPTDSQGDTLPAERNNSGLGGRPRSGGPGYNPGFVPAAPGGPGRPSSAPQAIAAPVAPNSPAPPVVPASASVPNQGFGGGWFASAPPVAPFSAGMPRSYNAGQGTGWNDVGPNATQHQVSGLKDITPASQPKLVSAPAALAATPGTFHGLTPRTAGLVQGFMARQPLPTEVAQGDMLGLFKGKLQDDLVRAQGNQQLIDKAHNDYLTAAERILSNNFGMLAALQHPSEE